MDGRTRGNANGRHAISQESRTIQRAVIFGSLLVRRDCFVCDFTFADTHSRALYVCTYTYIQPGRRGLRGHGRRTNGRNVYTRRGVEYVECIYASAANQLCRTREARCRGTCALVYRHTSRTKGAIVEIRIRPKRITYDRSAPEAQYVPRGTFLSPSSRHARRRDLIQPERRHVYVCIREALTFYL